MTITCVSIVEDYSIKFLVCHIEVLPSKVSEECGTGWFLIRLVTTGMPPDCGHAPKWGLVSAFVRPVPVAACSSEDYPSLSADHGPIVRSEETSDAAVSGDELCLAASGMPHPGGDDFVGGCPSGPYLTTEWPFDTDLWENLMPLTGDETVSWAGKHGFHPE